MALPQGGVRYFRKWLFDVPSIEENLSVGMVRDVERWAIPAGGSYELTDFMTDSPGRLYKRGGTSYQSSNLTGVLPVAVMAAEFPAHPKILAITTDGGAVRTLYDVTGTTAVSVGDMSVQPYENPPIFTDGTGTYMVVCDSEQGVKLPRKIQLTSGVVAFAPMVGSPPTATVSASHPPYFVLANTPTNPNRIWFSQRGILDSSAKPWPVSGINQSWVEVDAPVMAMTSFGGSLLVWTRHNLYRITGDYAPGDEKFNMGIFPVAAIGCIDARTVVKGTAGVYFANENGIWLTDGAKTVSITESKHGGISFMWREEFMAGYFPELGHVVAMGLYQDMYLFVTVTKVGVGTQSLLCYLPTQSWVRTSAGLAADMYATSLAGTTGAISNDIYLAQPFGTGSGVCRIAKAAGILTPTSANATDASGSSIQPIWTTRAFNEGSMALKRYGFGHLSYQMNSDSGSPTLTVAQTPGLEATGAFVESKEGSPLAETATGIRRRRFRIYKDAQAMTFKVSQNGNSDQTEIYSLEMETGTFYQGEGQ